MKNLKKTTAVLLTVILLSGFYTTAATAIPDEWFSVESGYFNLAAVDVDTGTDNDTNNSTEKYKVRKGDTLSAIADCYGIPLNELVSLNKLGDADLIKEGQVLRVPSASVIHTVAQGETLSGIAEKYGLPVKTIADASGLKNSDYLVVNQRLVIPSAAAVLKGRQVKGASRGLPVGEMEWPVLGWISSPFGIRDGRPHKGVDIAADSGAPIKSVMPGRVVFAGPRGTYGLAVIVDHGDDISTLYAHASKILVSEGQWVKKGQVIGHVGNTGQSNGPHLHLELLIDGMHFDPLLCMKRQYA